MAIRYLSGINVDSNTLFVDSANDRVGIGTATPAEKLHVAGLVRIVNSTFSGIEYHNTNGTWETYIGTENGGAGTRYNSASSQHTFYNNGSAVVRINSSGNVGIGTTSPAEKLQVIGNIGVGAGTYNGGIYANSSTSAIDPNWGFDIARTAGVADYSTRLKYYPNTGESRKGGIYNSRTDTWVLYGDSNNTPNVIIPTGNVGIGTTSPSYKLHVNGAFGTSPGAYVSGDTYGILGVSKGVSNASAGVNYYEGSTQKWFTGVYENSDNYGFYSVGTAGLPMVIQYSTGNVGIGNTSPNGALAFADDARTRKIVLWDGAANNDYQFYGFGVESSTMIQSIYDSADRFLWVAGTGTTTRNELMVLTGGGNLGIGTSSPSTKLHVAGTGRFEGNVGIGYGSNSEYSIELGAGRTGNGFAYIDLIGDATYTDYGLRILRNNSGANTPSSINHRGLGDLSITTEEAAPMVFSTSSAERMRITSAGNIGVNTTTPYSGTNVTSVTINATAYPVLGFQVGGSRTAEVIGYFNHLALNTPGFIALSPGDAEAVRITTAGNVGIGTTSPSYTLDVAGQSRFGSGAKAIVGTDGTYSSYSTVGFGGTTNGYNRVFGFDGTSDGLYLAAATGHGITFRVNGSGSDSMFINASGNVGIGTTSPSSKLQVAGSIASTFGSTNGYVALQAGGSTVQGYVEWFKPGPTRVAYMGYNDGSTANNLAITLENSANFIVNGGNVGIGTTAPGYKLEVAGNAAFTGSRSVFYDTGGGNFQIKASAGGWSMGYFFQGSSGTYRGGWGAFGSGNDLSYLWAGDAYDTATMVVQGGQGNVGVGTLSPYSKFEVTSNGVAWGEGITINPPASGYEAVFFRLEGTSGSTYTGTWAIGKNASSEAGGELFQVVKNGLTGSTAYRVDASQQWKTNGDSIFGYSVGIGNLAPTQKLHVTGSIRVTGAYYDSNNEAGTSGQVLSSTGSGTDWVTPATTTATSLYDLLPAARVAYNWTGQVVDNTWTTIFSKSDNILTTGTWMVQMYISDFAVGGGHYTYTYTGVMQWYQDTVNQTGEAAFSEIYLHRMGHAANASVLYLRTAESGAAAGNLGYFQIKGNYSNTSNTTINFKFVKIF